MSPRTELVHVLTHFAALGPVAFVVHELERLGPHLLAASEPDRIDECLSDRF